MYLLGLSSNKLGEGWSLSIDRWQPPPLVGATTDHLFILQILRVRSRIQTLSISSI